MALTILHLGYLMLGLVVVKFLLSWEGKRVRLLLLTWMSLVTWGSLSPATLEVDLERLSVMQETFMVMGFLILS
jgi:hypothetical protein